MVLDGFERGTFKTYPEMLKFGPPMEVSNGLKEEKTENHENDLLIERKKKRCKRPF